MIQSRREIAWIDPQDQLTCVDVLVILNENRLDEAGDAGCDLSNVAANIGVVGALDETAGRPPIVAVVSRGHE